MTCLGCASSTGGFADDFRQVLRASQDLSKNAELLSEQVGQFLSRVRAD
jgi:hypothetical protein